MNEALFLPGESDRHRQSMWEPWKNVCGKSDLWWNIIQGITTCAFLCFCFALSVYVILWSHADLADYFLVLKHVTIWFLSLFGKDRLVEILFVALCSYTSRFTTEQAGFLYYFFFSLTLELFSCQVAAISIWTFIFFNIYICNSFTKWLLQASFILLSSLCSLAKRLDICSLQVSWFSECCKAAKCDCE